MPDSIPNPRSSNKSVVFNSVRCAHCVIHLYVRRKKMAHLSESLVEEYLNRKKFLTIRGAKQGIGELDILGIRNEGLNTEGVHVEVQTSFRPVSYLSNPNAKKRNDEEVREQMQKWIEKKFTSDSKKNLRESIFPNLDWKFIFVCARVKDEREKEEIISAGIEIIPFEEILHSLIQKVKKGEFTTSSGGDLVEVMRYLTECEQCSRYNSD